jgi:hypothetical protein
MLIVEHSLPAAAVTVTPQQAEAGAAEVLVEVVPGLVEV